MVEECLTLKKVEVWILGWWIRHAIRGGFLLHFESFIILFYLFLGYLRKVVTDCDEENKIKNFYIRDRDLSSLESMNLFLHSICITANILFLDHQRWSMMGLFKVYELTHRRIMTFILKLILCQLIY